MNTKQKLIRITTVPISLDKLLEGQLAFMKKSYEVLGVSSGGETLERVAKKEGIRVIPVKMSRKITPFKDLKAVWELYKVFKKEQPYIVHSHTPKAGIVGMLAAKFANVPIRLHTVAGMPLLETTGIKRIVLNFVEKLTYSCATKVYPNSFGLREIILKNRFTVNSKLKVLAKGSTNGIDTTYFNSAFFSEVKQQLLKTKLGIQKEAIVFIFVGRLVGDKGINELVVAFKKLQNSSLLTSHFSLLLVGSLEIALDQLKKETLIEITNNNDIISVGWQEDVRPYLAISNCLVFPSYREGFPNVVLQAGAMSLPSIVTNINGCNEIIEDNKNGLIIPVKNSEAIYKAMKKIIEDKSYREQLQQNARAMIVSRYEQQVVWEAILAEYKRLGKKV
ncbi:MAG: glycosyltransferase family 1 protein [Flavobacteriaceae bacterium]|nr:MAG: glycosyltransferase family 1 protein [Flavobacteriaceae bacterium]